MKYIIVEINDFESAVLFSEAVPHGAVAGGFGSNVKAVSAGYCDIAGNTYGSSVSLKLKTRPQDMDIIRHSIKFSGV